MERRIFLQKLLKIPPVLLGLTWYSVIDDHDSNEYIDASHHMSDLMVQDAYYIYEDVLSMGWMCMYSGGSGDGLSIIE